jgi:hypothetical protein
MVLKVFKVYKVSKDLLVLKGTPVLPDLLASAERTVIRVPKVAQVPKVPKVPKENQEHQGREALQEQKVRRVFKVYQEVQVPWVLQGQPVPPEPKARMGSTVF